VSLAGPGQNVPAFSPGTHMHAKLTQAVAEKCEPNSGDYEIVDTLIPGFVLRVRPSGVKGKRLTWAVWSRERDMPRMV
jgi:hypothetical protein